MSLIIDNNVIQRVLLGNNDPDFSDLQDCIFRRKNPALRIHYGGKLRQEYFGNSAVVRVLSILDKMGVACTYPDTEINSEEVNVSAMELCVSNDTHIIALARVSKARLLCSHDQDLHIDFTNPSLINKPRGKVYQGKMHNGLLYKRRSPST